MKSPNLTNHARATLREQRTGGLIIGLGWLGIAAWRLTVVDESQWPTVAIVVLAVILLWRAVHAHRELHRRKVHGHWEDEPRAHTEASLDEASLEELRPGGSRFGGSSLRPGIARDAQR